ncbi:peptide/nickel transport system permease protein [Cetobacterium ceti]|uniref:Peptide/nickel transport system permease protein n=1 Tax=Cetobacterium ceti TaxID=180163 RepID=A0A1T4JX38_9FUSO|nr:peptide/nickel transport system permease protein [Cetobacterium ceti]
MAETKLEISNEKVIETNENVNIKKKRSPWGEVWRSLKKNKMALAGLFIIMVLFLLALFADQIADYDTVVIKQNLRNRLKPPSAANWLGTDEFGRDIFARLIHGARVSLKVGVLAVGISIVLGGTLGAMAGYYGGKLDNIIMRIMDIFLAVPSILLAIAIVSALGPNLFNLMVAISISSVPSYARIVRASVLSIRDQEFIEAARAIGASDTRIIFRHIIPNALAPVIVQGTLGVAGAILSTAGLSFIGLGIQPPAPEWGSMLSGGRQYLRYAWWVTTFPGLAIMITILSLNLLGDGLRDALDPRLKQ